MIRIDRIEKLFGPVKAVAGVSFDIERGEFFSILGASGSGKTTLLRIMAGFEAATAGALYIDGQQMDAVPPHLRPVNMVFQSYAIFPHLNVRDNIAFGLRKLKLGRAERARRVDEMLELIKLPGFGDRGADQLSGGQRQRIALARSLILKPKVLLLDEPLGALDKQLREQMQVELRALQRSVGITFVLVTHDQEEALTLSDRIAVMADGKVLQVDTPDGLYERPRTRLVASFVGNMNFLPARMTDRQNGHLVLDVAGLGACSVGEDRLPDSGTQNLCVAIRPEKIALHLSPPENGAPAIEGKVADRVYLGE
ncbi:MAG: ABC transporter ATP-binding protein, partial [Rubellimicrobium sp.]|nr:ABC transporter ATP-binding protein [Rubellimicrobium sp.]